MTAIRLTYSTGIVLQAVARGYVYGFDIMDVSGLPDGTVYPALRRLERSGLLHSAWEDEATAHAERRPARRYYGLTEAGRERLEEARVRFPGLAKSIRQAPRPAPSTGTQ
jgi:PadR family transcriptional regulator PadR